MVYFGYFLKYQESDIYVLYEIYVFIHTEIVITMTSLL